MSRLKRFFMVMVLFVCYAYQPVFSITADPRITIYDSFAPHYFIQTNKPVNVSLELFSGSVPISILDRTEIRFSQNQPWTLYLLIESSTGIDPLDQNTAVFNLLGKLSFPPERIVTFEFNDTIKQFEHDWQYPAPIKKTDKKEVRLFDTIQRMNQVIQKEGMNSVICFISSGKNTDSLIRFPLVSCPVWFVVPDKQNMQNSYLSLIASYSGGRLFSYQDLEEMNSIQQPSNILVSIYFTSIPYQWFAFRQTISISVKEGMSLTSFTVRYPFPWLSMVGMSFFGVVLVVIFLHNHKKRGSKRESHLFCFAWLEWADNADTKYSKRIFTSEFTIGSNPNCHLSFPDDSVSDYHALIQENKQTFSITDLSSRFGTAVNRLYIKQHHLEDGDEIQIGNIYLTFKQSHIKYESNEKLL